MKKKDENRRWHFEDNFPFLAKQVWTILRRAIFTVLAHDLCAIDTSRIEQILRSFATSIREEGASSIATGAVA